MQLPALSCHSVTHVIICVCSVLWLYVVTRLCCITTLASVQPQHIKDTYDDDDNDDDDVKDAEARWPGFGSTRWRTERTAALKMSYKFGKSPEFRGT